MGPAILEIDHSDDASAGHERNGQKGFKTVLRQLAKQFETRVLPGVAREYNRLAMLCHPAGDAFSQFERQPAEHFRMLVFRRAQDQLILFPYVDEAGVALHEIRGESKNLV